MNNILLKKQPESPLVYDSTNKEYQLKIEGVIVARLDQNGNMIIKGRYLTE